eukprot:GFUD01016236.1.p1 GENE.GFUD01016236.1~~GFUD01016236.1.p1  ORF type:complete len:432 (-),score=115.14 GFUD01016236.1:262-1557(-)
MVMDDMFGQLALPDLPMGDDPVFSLDVDLNPKDMMEDLPIDLEELEFDFEEMNDFGPWIETDVDNQLGFDSDHTNIESDRLKFGDLEIKEAVRYDCMWSSYNEFNSQKVKSNESLTLSNSFYDSLLESIDTPSCSETDTSSIKSEMDTDEEIDVTSEKKSYTNKDKEISSNQTNSFQSSAQLFASLDHCYNISSTHLDNEKYMVKNNGPLTPPVSSDEEESQTTFSFNLNTQTKKHSSIIKTKQSMNKIQSLLKKSHQKPSNEAKFSFKVNLKTDKSRSLLKQKIQKVKIIRTPFKTDADSQLKQRLFEHQKLRTCQSAIRKRKERSLKMQEGEAREVHNQMERQRRNELKVAFDDLKEVLPEVAQSDKASKQQILDKAVETCKVIKSTELSLQNRKNSLTKNNALLNEKLRLLKAEVKRRSNLDLGIENW